MDGQQEIIPLRQSAASSLLFFYPKNLIAELLIEFVRAEEKLDRARPLWRRFLYVRLGINIYSYGFGYLKPGNINRKRHFIGQGKMLCAAVNILHANSAVRFGRQLRL